MEKAKQAKNILSTVAYVGATLALGALSFAGMLVITSSLGWAALAFLLAVTIEGAVYKQNIFEAMKKLGHQKKLIEQTIADRELEKLKKHYKDNLFIVDYFKEKDYLHALEENLEKYSGKDKKTAVSEIHRVRARLNRLKDLLITSIRDGDDKDTEINTATSGILLAVRGLVKPTITPTTVDAKLPIMIKQAALDLEVKRKNRNMKLSIIVAAGSGIAAGLVTFSTIQTCLIALGVSLGTATIIGAPIVGFAALGYALLMYRTISDMIQNDTLKKWAQQIHEFTHTPSTERNAVFYLKMVGIVALVALAVFATVATAGTWWYLAKEGAEAIKFLPTIGGVIISTTTWALMIVPNLLFNLVNGLKSANMIPGKVREFFHHVKKDWQDTKKNENILQLINPFRILLKIVKGAMFVGHVVSTGITSDQVPWLSPFLTTSVNSTMEALTDLHYVAENAHDHTAGALLAGNHQGSDEAHEHKDHHSHAHGIKHTHSHSHEHEDHQHVHGDIILKTISFIFNYLSAGWDWLSTLKSGSWQNSKIKFFGNEALPAAPALSEEVARYDTSAEINELTNKYQSNGHHGKAAAFSQLQTSLNMPAPQTQEMITEPSPFLIHLQKTIQQTNVAECPLAQHRNRFHSSKPRSQDCLEKILGDRSYQLNRG